MAAASRCAVGVRRSAQARPSAPIGARRTHFGASQQRSKWNISRTSVSYSPTSSTIQLSVAGVELGGIRTALGVPLLKDNELVGSMTIYRQEVRPFTDKQIELVKNFAAKPSSPSRTRGCSTSCANRCQQQTATADVLQGHQLTRRATWSQYSRPCWRTRHASARPSSVYCSAGATARSARRAMQETHRRHSLEFRRAARAQSQPRTTSRSPVEGRR